MTALQLHLPGLVQPDHLPAQTIDERFWAFHNANPHVYYALEDLALDLVRRGRQRIAIGMLFEVVRWSSLRTDGDEYRLNNSFRALYARLLADTHPDLADAFEFRRRPSSRLLTAPHPDLADVFETRELRS